MNRQFGEVNRQFASVNSAFGAVKETIREMKQEIRKMQHAIRELRGKFDRWEETIVKPRPIMKSEFTNWRIQNKMLNRFCFVLSSLWLVMALFHASSR